MENHGGELDKTSGISIWRDAITVVPRLVPSQALRHLREAGTEETVRFGEQQLLKP